MFQELSANFFQSFSSLSPSDVIEIIGIIVSTSVSIIAIIISVKTLKQAQITNEQNNRMLEESTRPYINSCNDIKEDNSLPEVFHCFKVFEEELLENIRTNHSHQWTDIEFQRLREAFMSSTFAFKDEELFS